MSSERHRRLTEIFSRAAVLDHRERAVYLDQACAADPELLEEVQSLLVFDGRADDVLSRSAIEDLVRETLDDPPLEDASPSYPDRVGPYEILGVLGEGAQGVVFKAKQHTPRRVVALKVLRAGSFATRGDIRRFRKEIEALALMRHPAIATIYDGGRTDDGQHYFAMEFVDGTPINAFVRDNALSLRRRLDLFCKICEGVHYAHEQGVIHRDLKPTNILVGDREDPKVLDFGLVRLTDSDVSVTSSDSGSAHIVGSFRYMSPEQALGKSDEIRGQSDLYSLGVILYELLTGERPYELGSSLPDAVRTICEAVPPRPSAFRRELRGDLDTIVATALEKDPARRYGSVAQLADDVRRFLRGDPIMARRPSPAYLLSKTIRRHRVPTALLASALVLAAAWLGIRGWSDRVELQRAREEAVEIQDALERSRADRMVGHARSFLDRFPTLPEAALVLAQAQYRTGQPYVAVHYLRRGVEDGRQEWAFRLLLAEVQRETEPQLDGDLNERALLDFPDDAEAWHLRSFTTFDVAEAMRCARAAIGKDPGHLPAISRLAYLCELDADFDCAYEAAGRLLELHPRENRRHSWSRFQALTLMKQGRYEDAIERYDTLLVSDPDRRLGVVLFRAHTYLCQGSYERAVADYTELIESWPARHAWLQRWRATPLWILGRLEDAAADYESFRRSEGVASYADARLYLVRRERARVLREQGRDAESKRLLDEAQRALEAVRSAVESGSWLRKVLDSLAGQLTPEELVAAADQANPEQVCEALYYAGEVCRLQGREQDARRWFVECVETDLAFDVNERADPMSEYHLARWRVGDR